MTRTRFYGMLLITVIIELFSRGLENMDSLLGRVKTDLLNMVILILVAIMLIIDR